MANLETLIEDWKKVPTTITIDGEEIEVMDPLEYEACMHTMNTVWNRINRKSDWDESEIPF